MRKSSKQDKKTTRFSDVPFLQQRIGIQTPKSGEYFYDYKLEQARKQQSILTQQSFHRKYKINFSDLPVSQFMAKGLVNRNFVKMTQIQRCVIPHALAGRDIMAASRTGSGKTLCYLVPLVQKLYRQRFIALDGLGAIVIVPVRELAMQVFQVLNSITSHMELSIGLVIGGKDVQYQKQRIRNMNILVCTPGRILQHIEETYGFQTSNLKVIVLDQADVMMDMGFKATLDAILQNLPKCQTLLFSATLSKSIYALANLSLTDPEKIFLHDVKSQKANINSQQNHQKGTSQTYFDVPASLKQYYMIVKPQDKINTLYSFLKTHQKQKILVFVSTCKQARFLYQSFKKFRLGCPMYEIQGHQKQKKRMAIYFTFCQKKYGILISTNIASRGLDFPKIDWVVQFDIPQDCQTYIHRVGRTARYRSEGQAIALVTESQKAFVQQLKSSSVNIHKIIQNPDRFFRVQSSLRSICSEYQDIKYLAQRALISYLKFLFKASNKQVFKLEEIDTQKLAESYGLMNAPVIKINNQNEKEEDDQFKGMNKIQKMRAKAKLKKNLKKQKVQGKTAKQEQQEQSQQQEGQEEQEEQVEEVQSKQGQIFRKKSTLISKNEKPILTTSKRQLGKIKAEGLFQGKNVIHFDDDLNQIPDDEYRRLKYLDNNKLQVNQDRIAKMQMRKLQHEEQDKQIEIKRRQAKRKRSKIQRQQLKGTKIKNNTEISEQGQMSEQQQDQA